MNEKQLVLKYKDKLNIIIPIFFFIFYFIISIVLTYNVNSCEEYDFFFGFDTPRIVTDMTEIIGNHYRMNVHPLVVLIIQPIMLFVNVIIRNKMLTISIVEAVIGAINVFLMMNILEKLNINKLTKILLSSIYGFAFSSIISSSIPENYVFSAFVFLLSFIYIYSLLKKDLTKKEYIILIILGIANFSITITNIIQYGIFVLYLCFENKSIKFIDVIKVFVIIVISTCILSIAQSLIWPNETPIFFKYYYDALISRSFGESNFIDSSINLSKFGKELVAFLAHSFVCPNISVGKVDSIITMEMKNYNIISIILLCIFLLALLYTIVSNFIKKNYKENHNILIVTCVCLLFNFVLHYFYGAGETFIYSQHFLFLLIIAVGIILQNFNKEKVTKYFLVAVLIFEVLTNLIQMVFVIKYTYSIWSYEINILKTILISISAILMALLILNVSIRLYKKINRKYLLISIGVIYIVVILFVILSQHDIQIFGAENTASYCKEFNENYESDIEQLNQYKTEYDEFIKEYNVTQFDISNDTTYFIFGMGNRDKFLYKDGKLSKLYTEEVVFQIDLNEELVVPNMYTVLLLDNDGNTYKIYENNNGIFIETNLNSTDVIEDNDVELYNFDNQKYSNVKKVLYNEILINIVDGKPLPNLLVYDSSWYRDSAMVGMVLKNTNNLDLIKDFVLGMNSVYDLQNNGEEEADNLGEALYLISLVSDKNHPLVSSIINEIDNIKVTDENGIYLNGRTDFSNQPVYQTSFLKLGLEKLGIDYKIDYNYEKIQDVYMNYVWWYPLQTRKVYRDTENKIGHPYYPYLSWANYHKNGCGQTYINSSLYPLTYEIQASEADYNKMSVINITYAYYGISPSHSWCASEILLFLLDEDGTLTL